MEINLTQVLIAFTEVIKKTQKLDLNNINIFTKTDGSKVTDFDIMSDKILLNSLPNKLSINNKNYPIHYFSEENIIQYKIRKKWDFYWSVDPLDGTNNYIDGKSNYSINVALIKKNRPVLGFICLPSYDFFIYNSKNTVYYIEEFSKYNYQIENIEKISYKDNYFLTELIKENFGNILKSVDEFDISALDSILISLDTFLELTQD